MLPSPQSVRARIDEYVDTASGQGFHRASATITARASRSHAATVVVPLTAGIHYAVAATCDSDCGHIVLSLLDERGSLLVKSADEQDLAMIDGVPEQSGLYALEIGVPGCRERVCHVAFALLAGGDAPDGESVVAVTTQSGAGTFRPDTLAAAAGAVFDRLGEQAPTADVAHLRRVSGTYEQCTLLCALDERCAGVAFNRKTFVCQLHEQAFKVSHNPDVDSGIKRKAKAP